MDKARGDRIKEAIALAGLTQAKLAQLAGAKSARGIEENCAGKTIPGGRVLAVFHAAGINPDWIVTGAEPKLLRDSSAVMEQTPSPYSSVDIDTMTVVIAGVDKLLDRSSAAERASLVALAYKYMLAEGTTDATVLAEFLRHWAKTSMARPRPLDFDSPEVRGNNRPAGERRLKQPVGDTDNQGSMFKRRVSDK